MWFLLYWNVFYAKLTIKNSPQTARTVTKKKRKKKQALTKSLW